MTPSIEVVIPSFDRPESLRRTLRGLERQTHQRFSVAIVDDCSPIPVDRVLEGELFGFPIRTLRTPINSGPAAARNLGVQTSSADVIVFVDDDVVPDVDLVRKHLACLAGDLRTVSIGPLRAPADWRPTPWNRWEAETLAVEYRRMAHGEYRATWRQFFTGNAALRRDAFLAAGGFDEDFSRAEDIEFAFRLARGGAHFVFEPAAIGWHYAERSLASWRRIPGQYAEFDVAIDALHPELQWRRVVRKEASTRHPGTRAINRLARRFGIESALASVVISFARGAHGLALHGASTRLLSLAFHLEYARTQRRSLGEHRFNTASTAAR